MQACLGLPVRATSEAKCNPPAGASPQCMLCSPQHKASLWRAAPAPGFFPLANISACSGSRWCVFSAHSLFVELCQEKGLLHGQGVRGQELSTEEYLHITEMPRKEGLEQGGEEAT